MKIIDNLSHWQVLRSNIPNHLSLGFVPTMGNLHPGHISLVKASQLENSLTAVSIFVNPAQFNQKEDFTHYPRTLAKDIALLEYNKVDFCILPDEKAIYPAGYHYQIQETQLSHHMEGKHRPGHFNGVLTVVMKLFNLVKPKRAYFGEKDYQQYCLIRDMVLDFFMDIEIKSCPTIRESSGLAYSSRNQRLNLQQKKLAEEFAKIFQKQLPIAQTIAQLHALGIDIDYITDHENRRYAAVQVDKIRLIDNIALNSAKL